MSEQRLGRRVVAELRALQYKEPSKPTADIDVVWVLSGPGTVKSPPEKGPYAPLYKGHFPDRDLVYAGAAMVRSITALRLGKGNELVTKDDIRKNGPTLYYNGEDLSHPKANFSQNEDLRDLVGTEDFPIPTSRVVIHNLYEMNTPGQIKEFAEFLATRLDIRKVAIVTNAPHMRRVLRYLKHYQVLYPQHVTLLPAPIRETIAPVGRTIGEIHRIEDYAQKGYLAEEPLE